MIGPELHTFKLTRFKRFRRIAFSGVTLVLLRVVARKLVVLQSVAFIFNSKILYPDVKFYISREKLWKDILDRYFTEDWVGMEFGVAYGDASKIFSRFSNFKFCQNWFGFDTFYGLPESWGDLPKGAFSSNGKPPELEDGRFKWILGDVCETASLIPDLNNENLPLFIIFDLDLYLPTKSAADQLIKILKPGDVVYFDEAYFVDEARVISEIIGNNSLNFKCLGYTSMALALMVI
jgi:hypothetical protein